MYHATSRGNDRKHLFQDEADREMTQRKLAVSMTRNQVRLHTYVLMRNHLHLLVEIAGL